MKAYKSSASRAGLAASHHLLFLKSNDLSDTMTKLSERLPCEATYEYQGRPRRQCRSRVGIPDTRPDSDNVHG